MKYRTGDTITLQKPLSLRTAISITRVQPGESITIQQIDTRTRKYLVENVWVHHTHVEEAAQ